MNRICVHFKALIALAGMILCASSLADASTDKCSDLSKLALSAGAITGARTVSPGSFNSPARNSSDAESRVFARMPAFCRVILALHPTSDSDINVEVWMPASGWNGKFQGQGNGGFAGTIDYEGMAIAINAGYATAGTDTGHSGGDTDAAWALGHPEKIIDYGYRAIHEMTAKAKQVVAGYYGRPAKESYFASCSNGGREALMEAQRFPADYNGIIAGASTNNWTHNFVGFVWDAIALTASSASVIPREKLPTISASVLAACDGQEGVKDGILNDPVGCHFDPGVLLCKAAENDRCLTRPQVAALKKIYAGPKAPDGHQIYPGFVSGGELGPGGWSHWLLEKPGARQLEYANSFFKNLVFGNPNWDYRTMDFDRDTKLADARTAAILNATDPNLQDFRRNGGKLILYHGWSDAAIPPQNTIDYYLSIVHRMGDSAQLSVRLYMIPGMQHCEGGPGADVFGQFHDEMSDPHLSIYAALERWFETGDPPGRIIATKYENVSDRNSRVIFTRPLCVYPAKPKYKGTGDANDAANFSCEK
jgi:hypothetical protein